MDSQSFAALLAGYYAFVLSMWKQCKITPEQVEALVTNGRLTRAEADAILATPRDCP
jgi:hypothetical protein